MTQQQLTTKANALLARHSLDLNGKMELKALLEKLKQYRKFPSN